jgi:hypothetical protein
MPNDNPQMARRPALLSRHPRAGTSSPSVCVGDGRRFTNSEAGHPDTMPISRSRNCRHPERSEGSRFSHHQHTPRRDASAVGLSMTTEGCHSALLSRHPRAGGDPVRKCHWIPAFAGMTFELTCSRIAPQVPCHPERSEGSRCSRHRHAPRRDASAVGLSMTIKGCHPERSEGSRSSPHRHAPRRDASAVGLSMTTENGHPALLSRHPRAGTSSPSVCVGDGRRFTNSEAGHPGTMPISRSRNCCHPERSEGSQPHSAVH